jgi:hypothetical protein
VVLSWNHCQPKVLFEEYQISVLVPDKDLLETIPVMENPPADLPYRLLSKGNDLLDSATFERSLDGLFVAGFRRI